MSLLVFYPVNSCVLSRAGFPEADVNILLTRAALLLAVLADGGAL